MTARAAPGVPCTAVTGSVLQALSATHAWLERAHPGWAPPDPAPADSGPDGCPVGPAGVCPHGLVSWWLLDRSRDRPGGEPPLPPERAIPLPERLAPDRPDYVAVLDAHHRALISGRPGYPDPTTGLFVMTARTLWQRRTCCGSGCRHCPYTGRPGSPRG